MQIQFLGLSSPCCQETLSFYRSLGLPCLGFGEEYGILRAGTTQILIAHTEEPDDQPFYHFAFDIPRNQLANAAAWLGERVELLKRDGQTEIAFPDWNATSIYCHDPMGNIVELIARHNLPNDVEGGFGPEQILRVSEIGWPVLGLEFPDQDFGLPVWREYDKFQALGSETGLILLVENGRPWAPTGRPSIAAPCTLVIADQHGTRDFQRC